MEIRARQCCLRMVMEGNSGQGETVEMAETYAQGHKYMQKSSETGKNITIKSIIIHEGE